MNSDNQVSVERLTRANRLLAKRRWCPLSSNDLQILNHLTSEYGIEVQLGDLQRLDSNWYITHSGLLRLAHRKGCRGIAVDPSLDLSDRARSRYAFRAVVFTSAECRGFVGYGDADPTNVHAQVRGAELRIAETRAVNRALRKAYAVAVCSLEEVGSGPAPQAANGADHDHGTPASSNGYLLRDRLRQIIQHHGLDADRVKLYGLEFCGTGELRLASRPQLQAFIDHLSQWAAADRAGLLCRLNSYPLERKEAR